MYSACRLSWFSLKSFLPREAMRAVLFARETRFALEKVFVLVSHLCEGPGARGGMEEGGGGGGGVRGAGRGREGDAYRGR